MLHTLFKDYVIIQCSQYIHLVGLLLKWLVPKKGFRIAKRIIVNLQLQACNKSREPTSHHFFVWAKRQIAQAESKASFNCALWGLIAGSNEKPICARQILELQYANGNGATGLRAACALLDPGQRLSTQRPIQLQVAIQASQSRITHFSRCRKPQCAVFSGQKLP